MRKLSESIWGDIRKRSEGTSERSEDDINTFSIDGLCDYMNGIYESTTKQDIYVSKDGWLTVCLYEDETGYYRYLFYNGDQVTTHYDVIQTMCCIGKLYDNYHTHVYHNDYGVKLIDISPIDKTPVTNKFFLEILDFLLDEVDVPLSQQIEKK